MLDHHFQRRGCCCSQTVHLYDQPMKVTTVGKLIGGEVQLGEVHSSHLAKERFDKAGSLLRRVGHFRSSFRLKDRWVALQVNSTVAVLPELLHPTKEVLASHNSAVKKALLGEGKRAWKPLSLTVVLLSSTFLHNFDTAQNWWFIRHVWE